MISGSWLDRNDRPVGIEALKAMSWNDFEAFALDVVRQLYGSDGIVLVATGAGPDGGRDAEGVFQIGRDTAHAISLTLWVEIKRHGRAIGRQQVGGHIFAAINASANIIIIVSCSGFSKNFQREMEVFSQRMGLRYQLIDGEHLLAIAGTLSPGASQASLSNELNAPTARRPPGLDLLSISFSGTPWLRTLRRSSWLPFQLGSPVFVILEFEYRTSKGHDDIEVRLTCSRPGLSLTPVTPHRIRRVGPVERLSCVFLLRTEMPGSISTKDIQLEVRRSATISDGKEPANWQTLRADPLPHNSHAELCRSHTFFRPTTDQAKTFEAVGHLYRKWRRQGGTASLSIEAAAGVGKSSLLNQCRWLWLKEGVREIVLDGETEPSVWSILFTVLAHVLPVDVDLVASTNIPGFSKWLESTGVGASLAKRLATAICTKEDGKDGFEPAELREVFTLLLQRIGAGNPMVVIFEDLHKVGGSVLRLLNTARSTLNSLGQSNILFCFTSRFLPHSQAENESEAWALERERLFAGEEKSRYRLELPSSAEAKDILSFTISHLYQEFAEAIVERVGRTPFALTEAVRFLEAKQVVTFSGMTGNFMLDPESDLRDALVDGGLVNSTATDQRLELLAHALPDWALELVDLAACTGREFNLAKIIGAVSNRPPRQRDVDDILGRLVQEGILLATNRSVSLDWRFGHDLIREAALRRLVRPELRARHRRLAERLLHDTPPVSDAETLSLTFQCGRGDDFIRRARAYSKRLEDSGYPYEAAECLAIEDAVLDTGGGALGVDDAVYRVVPRPSVTTPPTMGELLDVKRRLFQMLSLVSGGAGETAQRLISDFRMLAGKARNLEYAALAERWDGDFNILSGNVEQAAICFEKAEVLYDATSTSGPNDKFEATLGHAIALRLLGKTEESATLLQRAIALNPNDPRSRIRFHANLGALFFYSDAARRRLHWQTAFEIAEREGVHDLAVHMELDLASLDIIDADMELARKRLDRLIDVCSERRFENSLMRALIMMSGIDLLDGWPDAALVRLDEARRLGYAHDSGKRLWKIHANSAMAYEMKNDLEGTYHEDRRVLAVLKAVAWERRIALAPANIILRAREYERDARFHALAGELQHEAREAAEAIVGALDRGVPLQGRFPQEHRHEFGGRTRFLAV